MSYINRIENKAYEIMASLADYVSNLYQWLQETGKTIVNVVGNSAKSVWNFLVSSYHSFVEYAKKLWKEAPSLFMRLANFILSATRNALERFFQGFLENMIMRGINGAWGYATDQIS